MTCPPISLITLIAAALRQRGFRSGAVHRRELRRVRGHRLHRGHGRLGLGNHSRCEGYSGKSGSIPIGRGIKTVCLNMGELGYFGDQIPQDRRRTRPTARFASVEADGVAAITRRPSSQAVEPTNVVGKSWTATWNAPGKGWPTAGLFDLGRLRTARASTSTSFSGPLGRLRRGAIPSSATGTAEVGHREHHEQPARHQANLCCDWYLPETAGKCRHLDRCRGYVRHAMSFLQRAS